MSAALPDGWAVAEAEPPVPEGWSVADEKPARIPVAEVETVGGIAKNALLHPIVMTKALGRALKKVVSDDRGAASLPGRLDTSIQESFSDENRAPLPKLPLIPEGAASGVLPMAPEMIAQLAAGGYNTVAGLVNSLPTAGTVASLNPIGAPIVGLDMLAHGFKGAADAGRAVVDPKVSTQEATEKVAGTLLAALPLLGVHEVSKRVTKALPEAKAAEATSTAEIEAQRAFDPNGTADALLPEGWAVAEEPASAAPVVSGQTVAPTAKAKPIGAGLEQAADGTVRPTAEPAAPALPSGWAAAEEPITVREGQPSTGPEITTPASAETALPASTPEGVSGSALESSGDQATGNLPGARKRVTLKVGNMPDGSPDLLTAIENLGGVPNGRVAEKGGRRPAEYDDFDYAFGSGPARLLRRNGGGIDTFIPQLESQGVKFDSIGDFYSAVRKASEQRMKLAKQLGDIEYGAKFDAALFDNAGRKPHLNPGEAVPVDTLNVGDTFKIRGEPVKVMSVDPDTGHVLLKDGVTREVPAGTPIFPDKGEIVRAAVAVDEAVPFASRNPDAGAEFAARTPEEAVNLREQLTQLQGQWRVNAQRVAPGLMEKFQLKFGAPEQLVRMGRAQARDITGHQEAAYLAKEKMLFLFDRALQVRSDMGTRINLLHEMGHAFWDTLPEARQAELAAQWQREIEGRTGPLFTKAGELKRGVARGVDSSVKEWFAERTAWANHEFARRRIELGDRPVSAGLIGRVAQQFRQLLLQLREFVDGLRGAQVDTQFRSFLDQGDRFADVAAPAESPAFAKRGAGVGVDKTADLFDQGDMFNLYSEVQKDQAPALEAKLAGREEAAKQTKLFADDAQAALFATRDAKDWLVRNFTSAGGMPKEVFAAKLAKDGRLAAIAKQAEFTLRDFDRAVRNIYGSYRAMTAAQLAQINDVLGGKAPAVALDPRLQAVVGTMRNQIDTLSRRLVREGAISGDLATRVDGNVGFYLNRSYRKFDDPKWAKQVPAAVRNQAESFVAAELQAKNPVLPVDPAEVKGYVDYLLSKDVEEPGDFFKPPREGAKDLRVFTKRQEIPREIRDLLGEYTDPRVNYLRSVGKTAQVLETHGFLEDARRAGIKGGWLHDAPRTEADGTQYTFPIAAKGSEAMAPLNGLYTTKAIAEAFNRQAAPGDTAWRWWLRANGWAKVAKTAFSPMTQTRNFAGNLGFLVANGHWRADAGADVWRALKADFGAGDTPANRAYLSRLTRLGVMGESVSRGELAEAVKDAGVKMTGIEDFTDSRLARVAKAPFKAALRIYRSNDDIFKAYAFENERRAWAAADPALTGEQLDTIAAERVRNTFPTYGLIPRAAQALRRVGLTGSFLSWPAEIIRTGYHTIGYALQDLANANPRVRTMGAKRLAGIAAIATAPYAAGKISQWLAGVNANDEEDLRRFLPEWNQNADLWFQNTDGKGRYRLIDTSYLDPYSYLKKPVRAALRGEDWKGALEGAAWESMSPFAGEGLLTKGLIDLQRNRDDRGLPVFNPQAPFVDQAADKVGHMWNVFEPGFVTQARRIVKGARGEVSPSGRAYNVNDEAQAVLTGARSQSMDVGQALIYKAQKFQLEQQAANQLYTRVRDNRGTVAPEEITAAEGKMEQARQELSAALSEDARKAQLLGVSELTVAQALMGAGLSRREATAIIVGLYLPFNDRPYTKPKLMKDAVITR